jgi:deoxyribose-phosphate aldolase
MGKGGKILVVVMAANRNWEDASASVKRIAARCPITVLSTPSAVREFGLDAVKSAAGVSEVLLPDNAPSAVELVNSHAMLVFATLSMNGLSKMVFMSVDSLPSVLAYYFLQSGKPVVAARDGIWCTHFDEPSPGTMVGRRAEEMLNQLKSMGVRVTTAKNLGSEVLWACGENGAVTGSRTTIGTAGKVFRTEGAAPPAAKGPHSPLPAAKTPPVAATEPETKQAPASKAAAHSAELRVQAAGQRPDLSAEHTGTSSCPHCRVGGMDKSAIEALGAERLAVCHPSETGNKVAFLIDHTLLKPNATQEEVGKLCEEAKRFCFASVCVNPAYVPLASQLLRGSGVRVCTVIGFPLGSTTPTVKAIEARDAMANGADEIDMVINVGALKSGNHALVLDDIRAVRDATRGKVLKVIIETAYLTKEEKVKACELSKQAGADFVKTSTGFGPGGATVEDIALMRAVVGPDMGVKASGGIRDQETALKMVEAGATRIGASASISITTGTAPAEKGKY